MELKYGSIKSGGVADPFTCSWDPPSIGLPCPDMRVCASPTVNCYAMFNWHLWKTCSFLKGNRVEWFRWEIVGWRDGKSERRENYCPSVLYERRIKKKRVLLPRTLVCFVGHRGLVTLAPLNPNHFSGLWTLKVPACTWYTYMLSGLRTYTWNKIMK